MRDEKGQFVKGGESPRKGLNNLPHQGFQKGNQLGRLNVGHPDYVSKAVRATMGAKISAAKKGKPLSEASRIALKSYWESKKGTKMSIEARRKMSEAKRGEKAYQWRGGLAKESMLVRRSFEMKLWREAVFSRDDYTCQSCKARGVTLNADHIKPFALFPELRFAIDNGRTLCVPCHTKVTREQHNSGIFINSVRTRFKGKV